ncbi:ankyrin repeat-containing domain protein, partial [Ochromonadaceae sp. CCMP2298]
MDDLVEFKVEEVRTGEINSLKVLKCGDGETWEELLFEPRAPLRGEAEAPLAGTTGTMPDTETDTKTGEISGADPNARDAMGLTPLLRAVLAGDSGSVGALLQAGADASVAEPARGRSALHFAAGLGSYSMLRLLLDSLQQARTVLRTDSECYTGLGLGVDSESESESNTETETETEAEAKTGEGCRHRRASFNPRDSNGNTPLHYAMAAAASPVPQENLNNSDSGSSDSIVSSICSSRLQTALLLLDRGAEVRARNKQRVTALQLICSSASPQMQLLAEPLVELLLQPPFGADPNTQDVDGCTPLLAACAYRHFGLCRLLLLAGGNLNIPCRMDAAFLKGG